MGRVIDEPFINMKQGTYLNTENIERSRDGVEYHPLQPFLPENARVLFLGSFPPQRKRWCMDFYYPNFINDHWRIEGAVFFGDRNRFVDAEQKRFRLDDIVAFCREKGIAFFDTSTAVRRLQDNASDKFLEVVEPTDVRALITRLPHLRAVANLSRHGGLRSGLRPRRIQGGAQVGRGGRHGRAQPSVGRPQAQQGRHQVHRAARRPRQGRGDTPP